MQSVDGLRPCEPRDHLRLHEELEIDNINKKKGKTSSYGFDHTQCLYDCKYEGLTKTKECKKKTNICSLRFILGGLKAM